MEQADLFGPRFAVPGLALVPDFLDSATAAEAIAAMAALPLEPFRFQRWTGHRRVASFGWRYDFQEGGFAAAPPLPDWLAALRARAETVAGLDQGTLVQALLTHYPPGAGIGWHRDRPVFDQVLGISLGAPATLRLRRRTAAGFERVQLPLPPNSLYRLTDAARWEWEHGIAPIEQPRWSITLRSLSPRGLRQTQHGPGGGSRPGRTG